MPEICATPPPLPLLEGIAEFNRGEYFECHETLERIWMREPGHIRRLYQGILQVGVGLYHLHNGNYRGALNLLGSSIGYLRDFAPRCMGVDVAALIAFATATRGQVLDLGPARFRTLSFPLPQIAVDPTLAALATEPGIAIAAAGDSPGHW